MAFPDDDEEDEKATVRCLDVARYTVAATVTVLIAAVIVCAATGALRPPDVALWVVGGSVRVTRNDSSEPTNKPFNASYHGDNLTFDYAVRAFNPSAHFRIYYTDIKAKLKARNSEGDLNSFLVVRFPDQALAPQQTLDNNVSITTTVKVPFQTDYFEKLGKGDSIDDALLMFNGTRIVENYSGHNMIPERVVYFCSPVVVSTHHDDMDSSGATAPTDTLCTESPPMAFS